MENYHRKHQLIKNKNKMTQPIKSIYMKSNITRLTFAVVVAGLLAACSAASPEENKEARLEKLKKEQADLAKEILKLEEQIAKENPDAESSAKAKEVAVLALAPKKFDHYVQTQGRVESENDILVSAKVPGVITQVYVNEGEQVNKGQVIAQLDNSVIVRSIESMESQLALATTVFERQENLWKQKIGTEVQYLQAKTSKESLEKQLASLREQGDMYRIKSPLTGTVDRVMAKVGEALQPGMPAARVVNNSDLKLTANVSEAYVTLVKKNNKVLVNIPELKKELIATVTFVGRTIDPLTRTFDVEISLPSHPDLRPNMTATVKVVFSSSDDAIVVPVNVIQQINDEKVVYIAEAKGKQTVARRKTITVDGVYGNQAQVKGLEKGDRLITVGYQGLNDGELVKI
jgi:membrane fusion protein, multidrug efflux system